MDFKSKELTCWIVPGIYFQGFLLFISFITGILNGTNINNIAKESAAAAIILFVVPVFGFIIGYIINFIGSYMEYSLYKGNRWKKLKIDRPSLKLLNETYKRTPIHDLDKLKEALNCTSEVIDNDMAAGYLREAKQKIKETVKIDMLHTRSTFARNLLTSHAILTIISIPCLVIGLFSSTQCKLGYVFILVVMILMLFLYWSAWRRSCIIYVRACFLEYLDTLPA